MFPALALRQCNDMQWHGVTSNDVAWRDRKRNDITSFLCSNIPWIAVVSLLCGAGSHLYFVEGEYLKISQCFVVDTTIKILKTWGTRRMQTILYGVSPETFDATMVNRTPFHENGWITRSRGFNVFRNNIRGWNITKERLFCFHWLCFAVINGKRFFPGMEWTNQT